MAMALSPPATTPALQPSEKFKLGGKKKVKAFGAKLELYGTCSCYGVDAPTVLCVLWCALVRAGGLVLEGIFRLAPDAAVNKAARKQCEAGKLLWDKVPPEASANLIKVFLRELQLYVADGDVNNNIIMCASCSNVCCNCFITPHSRGTRMTRAQPTLGTPPSPRARSRASVAL